MIVRARGKCLCTAANHPTRVTLQNNVPERIVTRVSFCRKATELSSTLPEELSHCQHVNLFLPPPWLTLSFCTNQVSSTVLGISGCNDSSTVKLEKSLDHIASGQVDYTIYTNYSVSADTRNGGATQIISTDFSTQPTIVSAIKIKGWAFTNSYDEEISAMESAFHWIPTNVNSVQTYILICTDSQSLCEVPSSCNPRTTSIRQCILSVSSSVFILWVPDWHSNIPGNDLADRAAKEAATIESGTIQPTPILCVFQVINELFRNDPPYHAQTEISINIARLWLTYSKYKATEMMYWLLVSILATIYQ